ncbi:unnamed protein product [Protopolystoma xenopodis]|uniref:Uncharacterized protein n=1 Tax=Protopolystoma xenopodis TaxID=117903 RepID=A0A448WT55_9PLAT|nr:unnamed protein product [Protopolystoma xenopodis]
MDLAHSLACGVTLQLVKETGVARLSRDADYDADELSGNVPSVQSDCGNRHSYHALRTSCVPPGLPANMTKS